MSRLFGTDGVRGIYEKELTTELAYQLGHYGSYVLSKGNHNPKIIIGMDTRISGKPLEAALVDGITAAGGDVLLAGVIPTPAIAVLVKTYQADAGIVISASHNPYQFNGIKFFNSQGFKLSDNLEDQIEDCIKKGDSIKSDKKGHVAHLEHPEIIYQEHTRHGFNTSLDGIKLIIDCANGASSKIAPDFFKDLGADVQVIADQPNGKNINDHCGSTCISNLSDNIIAKGADLGLAFDGDADRCLAVDEKGRLIDGDTILNLIGRKMKKDGTLKKDTVVVTVMSNIGLDIALKEYNLKSVKTDVGDRYVLEEMLKHGYNIGGEQSGHVILLDHNSTGDGMLTALMLASILHEEQKKASELNDLMVSYPQVLVNAQVTNQNKFNYKKDTIIQNEIKRVENHFSGQGRVLIRPSGTEPLVRVMIEGKDQAELEKIAHNLASLIEERLA
ncbi:MAG: phosphoglucosamine mutase [Eubacteriaceae bacterium]|nr:phosphoglucosamine mutase [Eubacteriaceae bacterium]